MTMYNHIPTQHYLSYSKEHERILVPYLNMPKKDNHKFHIKIDMINPAMTPSGSFNIPLPFYTQKKFISYIHVHIHF